MAVRRDGQLAVCDYGNNRIQVFDSNGTCTRVLGDNGVQSKHRLLQPSAVCFNEEGQVMVADYGNQRVVVFGNDDQICLELVGGPGSSAESFHGPTAVCTGRSVSSSSSSIQLHAEPHLAVTVSPCILHV